MKITIYTICIVFSILLPHAINAQSIVNKKAYIDSLMQIANLAEGEKRLDALFEVVEVEMQQAKGDYYINIFEEEVKKQNRIDLMDNVYMSKGLFTHISTLNLDSTLYYLDKAESYETDPKTQLRINNTKVAAYLYHKQYNLALYYVEKTLDASLFKKGSKEEIHAYTQLSTTYRYLDKTQEALNAANRALAVTNISEDYTPYEKRGLKVKLFTHMSLAYAQLEDFDAAIVASDSLRSLIKEIEDIDKKPVSNLTKSTFLIVCSRLYLNKGDLKTARTYIDSLGKIAEDTHLLTVSDYLLLESNYYYQMKDYNMSLKYLDKMKDEKYNKFVNTHVADNILRSRVLRNINRGNEAFDLYYKTIQERDSVENKKITIQMNELQTIYEVDKANHQIEIEQAKLKSTRHIVIGLVSIVILIICFMLIKYRDIKEKNIKNRKIYSQYIQMKSYLQELNAYKEETTKSIDVAQDKWDILIERMEKYLTESQCFRDETLTRDKLALALGTNRQYLAEAIKEKKGKTFNDYLNSIRLDYVFRELYADNGESIEAIYKDAGFASRSTFYRLFREQYGMQPNELREQIQMTEEAGSKRYK